MTDKQIYQAYIDWAKTHRPTWETDNLIGTILDFKDFVKPLSRPAAPQGDGKANGPLLKSALELWREE